MIAFLVNTSTLKEKINDCNNAQAGDLVEGYEVRVAHCEKRSTAV